MNTAEGTMPAQKPAMPRKKYTAATVARKRFTHTFSIPLTMPVYSHTVSPVTSANNSIIASGRIKHTTMAVTNMTPVIERVMRFFILSLIVISI